MIDVAKLRAERDPLDAVLKQRQAEYEKSMVKHAEFPSIPEVQNMHRMKYADRVRRLDAQIQKATDEVDKIFESIAQILWRPSPQIREPTNKAAAPASNPQQQQDTAKKQQAEINDLKTQLRQIQTLHSQEKEGLQADFAKRCKQMKEETEGIKEMMKGMKKEMMKEMKEMRMKATKEEGTMMGAKQEVEDVKEELRGMREELEKRQTESEQSQRNDLQSQLSKQEKDLKRVIADQLSEHKSSSGHVSSAEVFDLIQRESSVRVSDVSGLLKRVDELTGQLAQHSQETISLRADLTACNQQAEGQIRKVDEQEARLSNIDFDTLDKVAETMVSFDFPNLQRKVDAIQTTVDEFPEKHQTLLGQVQHLTALMGNEVGKMIDGVKSTARAQEGRIEALESSSWNGGRSSTAEGHAMMPEFESIGSDIASVKTDINAVKATVDGLSHEYPGLSSQIHQFDLNVKATTKDFGDQLDSVRHSVAVLDTKFNNLSTRALAEQIIGQLEQIYPNARQLAADTDGLKKLADGFTVRLESLEGQMQEHKVRFGDDGMHYYEQVAKHLVDCQSKNGLPQKRRRTDSGPNGAEYPVANGTVTDY
jgi:DNA repair exonuclease SbcCD ATPase subunit